MHTTPALLFMGYLVYDAPEDRRRNEARPTFFMTAKPHTIEEKLMALAEGAKYDASCASSGSDRPNAHGVGNTSLGGICHTWSADGRCISLLKILLTNHCIYDCAYCMNRSSNSIPRTSLTPRELADLTVEFYKRNYIEGLFLSSAITRSPDYTMELMIRAVEILRKEHGFNGYIHLKVLPGVDPRLAFRAGRLADRVSVNIELPTRQSLALLAPQKLPRAIVDPMRQLSRTIREAHEERKAFSRAPLFAPAGQSTQIIIGATPESDLRVIGLSERLYREMHLKRVYYSAFLPVRPDPRLPVLSGPPLLREHRLYEADWLIRCYRFRAEELLDENHPELPEDLDPKAGWALRNRHVFPVDVNRADYHLLLRVPGIGIRSAQRITETRRVQRLSLDDLKKLGVVMKRARYFVAGKGKASAWADLDDERVREAMAAGRGERGAQSAQLPLFPPSGRSGNTPFSGAFDSVVRGEL